MFSNNLEQEKPNKNINKPRMGADEHRHEVQKRFFA